MTTTRRNFLASSVAATSLAAISQPTPPPAPHVALVGDSIFDNGRYVPGKPSVIEQLRQELGNDGRATLLANDGDVTADVVGQLPELPAAVSHIVISVGGNDALGHTDLLDMKLNNSAELLSALAKVHQQFRRGYAQMLASVQKHNKLTAVCTIYNSNFPQPQKALADVALTVFNDAILLCASEAGVPVIDLRRIFVKPGDYANPIEPSDLGGKKMVQAIARLIKQHDFSSKRTTLYS
tara:strand:- start:4975 stop:5688 length:714 start_codon:yes stop_codon:yes gene_type:complete